jgi:hypothetical protein
MKRSLIAPCGMNCGICMACLRARDQCLGCRAADINKATTVIRCKIKNCKTIQEGKVNHCSECDSSPCKNLRHLDRRCRTKYDMSMIENLVFIRDNGIDKFIRQQTKKYECPTCGSAVCVHNGRCYEYAPIV